MTEKIYSNQSKIFFTAVVILAASLTLIFWGVSPLLSKTRETRSQIASDRRELADLAQKIETFKQATKKLSQIENDVEDVSGIFPIREKSVKFIEAIEDAVKRSGAEATLHIIDDKDNENVTPQKVEPLMGDLMNIEEVPYSLRFNGDYKSLLALLVYLENIPYLTEITSLSSTAQYASSEIGRESLKTGFASGELKGILFLKKP